MIGISNHFLKGATLAAHIVGGLVNRHYILVATSPITIRLLLLESVNILIVVVVANGGRAEAVRTVAAGERDNRISRGETSRNPICLHSVH